MPSLPIISGKKLIKVLERIGFRFVRQRGSHVILKHSDGRIVTVPLHKILKKGTLKKGILNPLNITVDDLVRVLQHN